MEKSAAAAILGCVTMTAMECRAPGAGLVRVDRPVPEPGPGEVLVEVAACGVCRTDLHVLDGEIPAYYPIVPGHEIVGRVTTLGDGVEDLALGDRVGVPWLGRTCGACRYCREGRENLCDAPLFTGATRDGGYASHAIADARYCFALPEALDDVAAAPLLCAGLIGWRAYRMAGEAQRLGLYGFGAAAHLLAQVAVHQGREVFAFTKPGDAVGQAFARALGCTWAGGSDEAQPAELDAAILFAPVGALVPAALRAVHKGGRVICAGIHMSDIPAFAYADLWGERSIVSVANLTRADGGEFLAVAAEIGLRPTVTEFPLDRAEDAIARVRAGTIEGAAFLVSEEKKGRRWGRPSSAHDIRSTSDVAAVELAAGALLAAALALLLLLLAGEVGLELLGLALTAEGFAFLVGELTAVAVVFGLLALLALLAAAETLLVRLLALLLAGLLPVLLVLLTAAGVALLVLLTAHALALTAAIVLIVHLALH